MARLPVVALIGRPNTGKSTLFNRLIHQRLAIESDVAGTTRDHVSRVVEMEDMDYLLIDTGGMGGGTDDKDFEDDVHEQSLIALRAADLILFVVDGRNEPMKSDFIIAELLRKKRRRHVPVLLVINKCDTIKARDEAEHAFHKLGVEEEAFPVSASHRLGTPELEEAISRHLKKLQFEKRPARTEEDAVLPRIAIIGKPNVGKSSICNALMSETQRDLSPKLVSPIAGTTRDSTDTMVRWHEQDFLFIDTAGIRRQTKVEEGVESLSMLRTIQSIEESDVTLLVIDATEEVSNQDKKIAGIAIDAGKGIIILLNKIDLVDSEKRKTRMAEIEYEFRFCRYAPVIPVSAITRDGLLKIFDIALMVQRNRLRRIAPKELLRFMRDAVAGHPMSSLATCKHIVQAKDPPPTFVLFVRNPKTVRLSQLRFMENRLREGFGMEGTPVRWITKGPRDRKLKEE